MRGVALCEPSAIRPVILPPKRSPQCWLFVAPSARGRHRLVDGAGLARGAVGDADARRERGPDDRAAHDTRRGSRKRSDPPSCEAQGGSSVGTKAPLRERHARESYKSCRRCLSNRRLRRESHSRTPYPSAKPTIRAIGASINWHQRLVLAGGRFRPSPAPIRELEVTIKSHETYMNLT